MTLAVQYRESGFSPQSFRTSIALFERTPNGEYLEVYETPALFLDANELGSAVALDGDWMAVSVPDGDGPGGTPLANTARVEIFHRGPSGWQPHSTLPTPFPAERTAYGEAVALQGEELIVSAPRRELPGIDAEGVVFVHRLVGGSWELQQELQPDATSEALTRFGTAVGLEGDTLLVEAGFRHGFVFARTGPGSDWQLEDRIDDRAMYRLAGGRIVSKGLPSTPLLRLYERDPSGAWATLPDFVPVDAPGFRNEFEWDGRYLLLLAEAPISASRIYERVGTALHFVQDLAPERFTNVTLGGFSSAGATAGPLVDGRVSLAARTGTTNAPFTGQVLHLVDPACGWIGRVECVSSLPNSIGLPSSIQFTGSADPTANDVTLTAVGLPPGTFGILLVARAPGVTESPGISFGTLCLGGPIGRFNRPGEVLLSSPSGNVEQSVGLSDLPLPGQTTVSPLGETLYFQVWYRDWMGGVPSAHFTSALTVDFAP
ncbi:MAG: hypothetical protein AAFQ53_05030 [Bacteroidota bacterium]